MKQFGLQVAIKRVVQGHAGKTGMPPGPGDDLPPKLGELLAYWRDKGEIGRLPGRQDIHPEEIAGLLPYLMLYDVLSTSDGNRYRIRLMGTHVVEMFGPGETGHFLDEVADPTGYPAIRHRLDEVVASRQPSFGRARVVRAERDFIEFNHITLPLAQDGETVDMLIGMRMCACQ